LQLKLLLSQQLLHVLVRAGVRMVLNQIRICRPAGAGDQMDREAGLM
jgi:hypothetical protein